MPPPAPRVVPSAAATPPPFQPELAHAVLRQLATYVVKPTNRLLAALFTALPSRDDYPDYYDRVPTPMALDTLGDRVRAGVTASWPAFRADLEQIAHNARIYNTVGSRVVKDADKLVALGKAWLADAGVPDGPSTPAAAAAAVAVVPATLPAAESAASAASAAASRASPSRATRTKSPVARGSPVPAVAAAAPTAAAASAAPVLAKHEVGDEDDEDDEDEDDASSAYEDGDSDGEIGSAAGAAATRPRRGQAHAEARAAAPTEAEADGAQLIPVDAVDHDGVTYRVGDYGYVANAHDPAQPLITQILGTFRNAASPADRVVLAGWFLRPSQTMQRPTAKFMPNEVLKVNRQAHYRAADLRGRCAVLYVKDYIRGRPRGVPERDVYVCEQRYSLTSRASSKIKHWTSTLPDGVRHPDDPAPFQTYLRQRQAELVLFDQPRIPPRFPIVAAAAAGSPPGGATAGVAVDSRPRAAAKPDPSAAASPILLRRPATGAPSAHGTGALPRPAPAPGLAAVSGASAPAPLLGKRPYTEMPPAASPTAAAAAAAAAPPRPSGPDGAPASASPSAAAAPAPLASPRSAPPPPAAAAPRFITLPLDLPPRHNTLASTITAPMPQPIAHRLPLLPVGLPVMYPLLPPGLARARAPVGSTATPGMCPPLAPPVPLYPQGHTPYYGIGPPPICGPTLLPPEVRRGFPRDTLDSARPGDTGQGGLLWFAGPALDVMAQTPHCSLDYLYATLGAAEVTP